MKKLLKQKDNTSGEMKQFPTYPACTFDHTGSDVDNDRHLCIYMDVSNQCNLRCTMCDRLDFDPVFLGIERFKHIADSLFHRARMVVLSCAFEPLMYKDFFKYLEIAGQYDVPNITVTTNATLLTRAKAEQLVKSELTNIHVSIDGASRETYESIRVGARFDILLNNLRQLKEIKKEMVSDTPKIQFQFVLLPENFHEAPEIIPLLAEFNPCKFLFIHNDFQEPSTEKRTAIKEVLYRSLEKCVKHNVAFREVPISCIKWEEIFKAYGKDDVKIPNLVEGCLDPWNFMMIRSNGDVFVCPGASAPAENILQTDILKIWNGNVYRKLREDWNRQGPPKMCRECTYYGVGQVQLVRASEQLDELIGL